MLKLSRGTFLLTALVSALAAAGCRNHSGAKLPDTTGGSEGAPRSVQTLLPIRDHASERIKATGTTEALSSTKIMSLVPGLIVSLPIKEGDQIKRGQVLAMVDQRGFRLSVRQAEAAIASARVALNAATREKERFEKLLKEDATARAQFDQVMDRFHGAEATMNQALVARDMAKKSLTDTVIRSPYDGVVVKKMASLGDYATTMPPTVLMSIMDIHALELKIALPEPDLSRVAIGAQVQATFSSVKQTLTAKVSRIVRSVDPITRSFEVIAEVPNPGLQLKSGLFADVEIIASRSRERLLLPNATIIDEGNGVFSVFVVRSEQARRVEVRVAVADQSRTEILSGLAAGDLVIADPAGLIDGDPVQAKPQSASSVANGATAP